MTIKFDKNAIKEHRIQKKLNEHLQDDVSLDVGNIIVKDIPPKVAREYIATFHYSHIMPDSCKETYGGYIGLKLAGIIAFGTGASNEAFTRLIPNIKLDNTRELIRLWSPDGMPKNTESKMISKALKMLPKNVKLIISFADPFHNHIGMIYQATNFLYCGMTKPSKMLIDKDGTIFHVRTIGSYMRRHPELEGMNHRQIMEKYGWKYVERNGKHRYIYLLGTKKEKKEMIKILKDKILPYPKTAECQKCQPVQIAK